MSCCASPHNSKVGWLFIVIKYFEVLYIWLKAFKFDTKQAISIKKIKLNDKVKDKVSFKRHFT